jgi:hypothetical protein
MIKRGLLLLLFLLLFSGFVNAALGISPAVVELDFTPGGKHEILYTVISDQPQTEIEIMSGGGPFGEYIRLSKKKIVGPGTFKLTVEFPDEIDSPGENRVGIGVKEAPPEDQFLGTSISISGVIIINAPYPGRYIEADLIVADGNVDEEVPVESYVINRGKEDVNVNVNVGIFSEEAMVHNMVFTPVVLKSNEEKYFRKFLNTTGYRPGNYFAEAVFNYGNEVIVNKTFRIGSLFVDVINFTERLPSGGIQKFYIDVKSLWNNNLPEVFADVNVSNSSYSEIFRTPSVDLRNWEGKTLVGFLDTEGLDGNYNSEITLYYDKETTVVNGVLLVSEGLGVSNIVLGVIAIVVILVMVIVIWRFRKKAFKLIGRKK